MRPAYQFVVVLIVLAQSAPAQTWTPLSVGITTPVMYLSFPSSDTGFASLGNGTMRKTYDGGLTWTGVSLPEPYDGPLDFRSSLKGYILDDSGVVMTSDGGVTWSHAFVNTTIQWMHLFFYDDNVGYASGISQSFDTVYVFSTTDGGITWLPCSPIQDFNSVWPVLFFRTATEGYVTGSDKIYRTVDGGITWTNVYTTQNPDQIGTIFIPDANNAYCATQYFMEVAKSTNGGNSWAPTVQVLGSPAYGSYFRTGLNGYICGGDGITSGYIIETSNGGTSWSNSYSGGQTMLCIDFPSTTTGYCGGTGGIIMKYSDPMSAGSTSSSLLSVFPNPATDFLNVVNIAPGSVITITNNLGQIVKQETTIDNRLQIDVSNLAEGIYSCQVISEGTRSVEHVIIQK